MDTEAQLRQKALCNCSNTTHTLITIITIKALGPIPCYIFVIAKTANYLFTRDNISYTQHTDNTYTLRT